MDLTLMFLNVTVILTFRTPCGNKLNNLIINFLRKKLLRIVGSASVT